MLCFKKTKIKIKYWLAVLLATVFFLWWDFNSASADDLLWQLVEPAYEEQIIIGIWKSKEIVWDTVMKWVTEFWAGVSLWRRRVLNEDWSPVCRLWPCSEACAVVDNNEALCRRQWKTESYSVEVNVGIQQQPSIIVLITRMLLVLTIALSITMILYNSMIYIIQSWQWKDAKSLTKNIAYIIVWILVALFSVIIIRIIQSIPSTLWDSEELPEYGYEQDKEAISQNNAWVSWRGTILSF